MTPLDVWLSRQPTWLLLALVLVGGPVPVGRPRRRPLPAPPAPAPPLRPPPETPMTDTPTSEATMTAALRLFGWTCGPEFWERYYRDAWVFNLANAVERLVARVEAQATQVADAHAAIRRLDDFIQAYMPHFVDHGFVDRNDLAALDENNEDTWTPGEVDAIRRARSATQETT